MPYIKRNIRAKLTPFTGPGHTKKFNGDRVENSGELNYLITSIINEYLDQKEVGYSSLNDVIGVLECAKLELYRRIIAPYEDIKIEENGDVYL